MKDENKTKKQLIEELKLMRQQAEEFEKRAFPIRKQRDDLLQKFEESRRSLFDYMLDGYAYCKMLFEDDHPQDFIYLDVNPTFKTLTGLKNVVGQKVSQVIPGIRESNPELFEIYGRVALTGKPERFETYVPSLEIWFDVSVFSPAKEDFVAIFENITERKRAEEATLRAKKEWERTFDTVPDLIAILDDQHRIVRVNRAMADRLSVTPKDCIGLPCYEAVHGLPEPPAYCPHSLTCRDGQQHVAEVHEPRLGGDFLVSTTPLCDPSGQLVGSVHVARDITERKRAEEALQEANESLEQRVRERTLQLQNLTEMLEKGRDDLRMLASELVLAEERERKRIAAVLHDEIAQTLAVVKIQLDVLQAKPGGDVYKKDIIEAQDLLREAILETRALMNEVGNPLLFEMGVAAACEALADRLMARHSIAIACDIRDTFKDLTPDVKVVLFQVIRELLNNIVKHSKARNVNVMINTENGLIRAKIKDDGVGFDPQILGAPTAVGGFGLFSIRERLMAFNGRLQIESAPGKGTVATAILSYVPE